jgi:hypothetical protein
MKVIKLQMIIAYIFVSVMIMAQTTQTVRGKILDRQTGFPVSSIAISVQNHEKHTVSNNDGSFTLENIPLGRQHFFIQHLGYEHQELLNISVDTRKETYLEILQKIQKKVNETS